MVAVKDESHDEYDAGTNTYRHDGNWETESVSAAVIEAVSTVTNTPTTDLDPLYNVINPDALDRLYKPMHDGAPRLSGGTTAFIYSDCRVTVHADGEVKVNQVPQE